MEFLSDIEIRIIGSLIEKELTTPEYYPLTLNALANACNQKSSREPVVTYSENEVEEALNSLREKKLARMVQDGGRVAKFKEAFVESFQLSTRQTAVITLLLLRGPQTVGELRARSGRLYDFSSLEEVDETLQELSQRIDGPFIIKLDKLPGMKERRFSHLFSGIPVQEQKDISNIEDEKIAQLTREIESLRSEMDQLKSQFAEFKRQFE